MATIAYPMFAEEGLGIRVLQVALMSDPASSDLPVM